MLCRRFHRDTSQVTLHPVVVYYRDIFGIVSDKREYNDLVVHKFIQVGVNSITQFESHTLFV